MAITCCCCIPIRVGVIILAVLGVVAGFIIFYDGASFFFHREQTENQAALLIKQNNQPQEAEKLTEVAMKYLLGASIANLILGPFDIILSIVLLMGVSYRHPTQLKIWVKVAIAGMIFTVGTYILVAAFGAVAHLERLVAYVLFVLAVFIPLKVYYIYVVQKYAGILEDESRFKEGVEQKA